MNEDERLLLALLEHEHANERDQHIASVILRTNGFAKASIFVLMLSIQDGGGIIPMDAAFELALEEMEES